MSAQPDELTEADLRRGVAALVSTLGEEKTRAFLGKAAAHGGRKQLSDFVAQALLGAATWARANPQAAITGAAVAAAGGIGAVLMREYKRRAATAPPAPPPPAERDPRDEVTGAMIDGFDPSVFAPQGHGAALARPAPKIDPETGYIDVDGYEVRR